MFRELTKRPARCFLSADGENWTETTRSAVAHDVNEFPIPPELVGAETLWVRYEGFGYGADECHAAFAFLSPGRTLDVATDQTKLYPEKQK